MIDDFEGYMNEQFARRVLRSGLGERPAAWISRVTGQVNLRWSGVNEDEIEYRIASTKLPASDCQLCGDGTIGIETREGTLAFDGETKLPVFYPGTGNDQVCARCADWIVATWRTKNHLEETGRLPEPRFDVGDQVTVCGEQGIWTVRQKFASGILSKALVWAAYVLDKAGATTTKDDCLIERKVDMAHEIFPNELTTRIEPVKIPEVERPKLSAPKLDEVVKRAAATSIGFFGMPAALEQDRRYEELLKSPAERKKLR